MTGYLKHTLIFYVRLCLSIGLTVRRKGVRNRIY